MKRLHVHVSVADLDQSVRFYATLFAAEPSVLKPDYAKWMLDDPRVNFAISQRGGAVGVQHLGIQAEDTAELGEIYDRLKQAERPIVAQAATICCYAKSDKQWIADPQGVAWETFLTQGEATVYGDGGSIEKLQAATGEVCCEPALTAAPVTGKPAKSGCGCAT
jgi:catechol 2,3-dioxygenase-like lactoylglutathione lyase family enzyme